MDIIYLGIYTDDLKWVIGSMGRILEKYWKKHFLTESIAFFLDLKWRFYINRYDPNIGKI
jgi:hypothetical protein